MQRHTVLSLVVIGIIGVIVLINSCTNQSTSSSATSQQAESAEEFVARINKEILEVGRGLEIASWIRNTYITPDTAYIATKATEKMLAFNTRTIQEANRYNGQQLAPDTARSIQIIKQGTTMPAPKDAHKRNKLAQINTDMEGMYGKGRYCKKDRRGKETCRDLEELSQVIATSRNYNELLDAWKGWRTVSVPMRDMYREFVAIMNEGAHEMGFENTAHLWKSGYDMPVDAFENETERLWTQVKPLYDQLHCYVRDKFAQHYGEKKVPAGKPIPAHLFGNMWAQQWGEVYDLLEPYPGALDLDITGGLVKNKHDAVSVTKMSEKFFTSIGLPALPDSFYTNSLLKKPRDRDVVCHASAWDMDNGKDVRVKQCVEPDEDSLVTMHHELGHIYYFIMYQHLAPLFKGGANDGFHEAIGDTVVLSMTPKYMKQIGLIDKARLSRKAIINYQMKMALDKIAFLPFGKLIDQWRWKVFSGEISPDDYNHHWWRLREYYQGIRPPVRRNETHFDPGAKYHVPANVPYTRYFLAHIMQFQFHKSLCKIAGHKGPLHECSIYGNKKAGAKLGEMLALGASQPWPHAMQLLTGQKQMEASAIIDYFAPLMRWLRQKNHGKTCGWSASSSY